MADRIATAALEQLLLNARTQNKWLPKDVSDSQLREIVEITRMGPTSANTQPARFVFVRTKEGKDRLLPYLSQGNRDKTRAAPVCAIIAYDLEFHENLPRTFPHRPDAKSWFTGKEAHIQD